MKVTVRQDLLENDSMPLVMSTQVPISYIPLNQLCDATQEFEAWLPERIGYSEYNLIIISKTGAVLLVDSMDFDLAEE